MDKVSKVNPIVKTKINEILVGIEVENVIHV